MKLVGWITEIVALGVGCHLLVCITRRLAARDPGLFGHRESELSVFGEVGLVSVSRRGSRSQALHAALLATYASHSLVRGAGLAGLG